MTTTRQSFKLLGHDGSVVIVKPQISSSIPLFESETGEPLSYHHVQEKCSEVLQTARIKLVRFDQNRRRGFQLEKMISRSEEILDKKTFKKRPSILNDVTKANRARKNRIKSEKQNAQAKEAISELHEEQKEISSWFKENKSLLAGLRNLKNKELEHSLSLRVCTVAYRLQRLESKAPSEEDDVEQAEATTEQENVPFTISVPGKQLRDGIMQDDTNRAIAKEVLAIKKQHKLSSKEIIGTLCDALFGEEDIVATIKDRAKLLIHFIKEVQTPSSAHKAVFDYLEKFALYNKHLMLHFSRVLKVLHDKEVIPAEAFVKWHDSSESRFVKKLEDIHRIREAASKFMNWLQPEEEEDDDDEEEGEALSPERDLQQLVVDSSDVLQHQVLVN